MSVRRTYLSGWLWPALVLLLCTGSCESVPTISETQIVPDNDPCGPGGVLPSQFAIWPPFPNPFTDSTLIGLDLPTDVHLELVVRNPTGDVVRTLFNQPTCAGIFGIRWDGSNDAGEQVGDGVYLITARWDKYSMSTWAKRDR